MIFLFKLSETQAYINIYKAFTSSIFSFLFLQGSKRVNGVHSADGVHGNGRVKIDWPAVKGIVGTELKK